MKVSDFNYDLPKELIAQHPMEKRDESRLMLFHRDTKQIQDKKYKEVIDYLENNDVDSFVILDDEKEYLKGTALENNLVQTSLYDGGLKDIHIEKVINILNQRSRF